VLQLQLLLLHGGNMQHKTHENKHKQGQIDGHPPGGDGVKTKAKATGSWPGNYSILPLVMATCQAGEGKQIRPTDTRPHNMYT